MKGREGKGAAAPADLLVCFPSRAHLSLMPKPICSPARRPSEHNMRHRHLYPHHRRNKSTGPARSSPSLWTKNNSKQAGRSEEMDEPTSPKVTCAGQIKVRPTRSSACRNWQSVMEEIERIHNHGKQKKKTTWADSLGFKKEILQFLTCLRSIRFDFRCFGSFPHQDIIASDEDDGEEEGDEDEDHIQVEGAAGGEGSEEASTAVFSKWFTVLQENKGRNCEDRTMEEPAVPPPNALLLMRCRSAPAQSRPQQSGEEAKEEGEKAAQQVADEDHHRQQQQKTKKRESLAVVMKYDTDFNRLSPDIAKEAWVVSGLMDPLSRSRSWKRW